MLLVLCLVVPVPALAGKERATTSPMRTRVDNVAVVAVRAAPGRLPARGGSVAVFGRVRGATECQLRLVSSQSFPVFYSSNRRDCSCGAFAAEVMIGSNSTLVPRVVALALVARRGGSAALARFYVLLAAATGALPTTADVPSTAPSAPPTVIQSSNWSGYAATGGPYSAVKGTFTVPGIVPGTPSGAQVSEWVGIDGERGGTSLIQAGVREYADPEDQSGFDVQPWWEILPDADTDITAVTVSVGDSVTVTIWKVSRTKWEVNLTDDTNHESYTIPPWRYGGPGSSAEWVLEATARCASGCPTGELASYGPDVVFSGLGMTGRETTLDEDTMVQGGLNVSAPSALVSGRFVVIYNGAQPYDSLMRPASLPENAKRPPTPGRFEGAH